MKRLKLYSAVMSLVGLLTVPAWAGGHSNSKHCSKSSSCSWDKGKAACAVSEKKCYKSYGKKADCYKSSSKSSCPLSDKFYKKYKFVSEHAEELGLSEEQRDQLRRIKFAFKQNQVQAMANCKVMLYKLKNEMYEMHVDTDKTKVIISNHLDKKEHYLNKSLQMYADMKKVLDKNQWQKAKEIWRAESHSHKHHS